MYNFFIFSIIIFNAGFSTLAVNTYAAPVTPINLDFSPNLNDPCGDDAVMTSSAEVDNVQVSPPRMDLMLSLLNSSVQQLKTDQVRKQTLFISPAKFEIPIRKYREIYYQKKEFMYHMIRYHNFSYYL